jgi:hypothetical protein
LYSSFSAILVSPCGLEGVTELGVEKIEDIFYFAFPKLIHDISRGKHVRKNFKKEGVEDTLGYSEN